MSEPLPGEGRPRVALIGPLPPPSGGMANQTRQHAALLDAEGFDVHLVRTNPAHPGWVSSLRGVRAAVRLAAYLVRLLAIPRDARVYHVMANSWLSWHLWAAPAIWVGAARRCRVVVNYRGGELDDFLARQGRIVSWTLRRATGLVVPSGFLQGVFREHGWPASIIPNVVDLARFAGNRSSPLATEADTAGRPWPSLLMTRNLEALYGIDIAIEAFRTVKDRFPRSELVIAGDGPERHSLEQLARSLGLEGSVRFTGTVDNADAPGLYRAADIAVNASRVDNMPVSILEALASGVPVVSTEAGGIPFMVEHSVSARLVPVDDPAALAREIIEVASDPALASRLAAGGRAVVARHEWQRVRDLWLEAYGWQSRRTGAARDRVVAGPSPTPVTDR